MWDPFAYIKNNLFSSFRGLLDWIPITLIWFDLLDLLSKCLSSGGKTKENYISILVVRVLKQKSGNIIVVLMMSNALNAHQWDANMNTEGEK